MQISIVNLEHGPKRLGVWSPVLLHPKLERRLQPQRHMASHEAAKWRWPRSPWRTTCGTYCFSGGGSSRVLAPPIAVSHVSQPAPTLTHGACGLPPRLMVVAAHGAWPSTGGGAPGALQVAVSPGACSPPPLTHGTLYSTLSSIMWRDSAI